MTYVLLYDSSVLKCEIVPVPEGKHLNDVKGKYATMDAKEFDQHKGTFSTYEEAKNKAISLLDADIKALQDIKNRL